MLFIDNNEPEALERGKNGRTGTDSDADFAACNAPPLVKPFPLGQSAVQQGDALAEAGPESTFHLRDQSDFRHQDQHRHFIFQCLGRQTQIYFGFAAARDAREQEGLESGPQLSADLLHGRLLFAGEYRRPVRRDGGSQRVPVDRSLLDLQLGIPCHGPRKVGGSGDEGF